MATVKYIIQSKKDYAQIYLRFCNGRNCIIKKKIDYVISQKNWIEFNKNTIQKSAELKLLKIKLEKLTEITLESYNTDVSNGLEIDKDWLQQIIDTFNNKIVSNNLDLFTTQLDKYISSAHILKNAKNSWGLSENRIKGLKSFKNLFERFEKETFSNRKYLVKNIDKTFIDTFKDWSIKQKYANSYIAKNIDNIKTICNYAQVYGITVSNQLNLIRSFSDKFEANNIIYLNNDELEKIHNTDFQDIELQNAKKWLLFGCHIGQRVSDLLKITGSDITTIQGCDIINLTQKKTNKNVNIPLLQPAKKIIEGGMPYRISYKKLNTLIKEVCKQAGIDQIITGRIRKNRFGASELVEGPKHQFISTHICRRSFASNYYKLYEIKDLKMITGHSTDKMFQKYVGKTSMDHVFNMLNIEKERNQI